MTPGSKTKSIALNTSSCQSLKTCANNSAKTTGLNDSTSGENMPLSYEIKHKNFKLICIVLNVIEILVFRTHFNRYLVD